MARIPCLKCGSYGHDPEIQLCSLCRMRVERLLKAGKTPTQIGGISRVLQTEAAKVEAALTKSAPRCPHCGGALSAAKEVRAGHAR